MPGIGVGVSPFLNRGGKNWNLYWATHLLPDDLSLWIKANTRNELILPDTIAPGTNDASILLPCLYKVNTTEYAYIADNGELDIGATDFTLAGWVKSETAVKTANRYLLGKNVSGSVNGRYGIGVNVTSGTLFAMIQSSSNTYQINSNVDFTTQGWVFVLMDVDQTNKKLRLFMNNVQYGADLDYLGTFNAMSNAYEFYIGTGNANGGAGTSLPAISSHGDVWVFNKRLSAPEMTTLYNHGIVSGAKAHYTCLPEWSTMKDYSGNGYHLTTVNILLPQKKYSTNGSRQSLNVGYTLYQKPDYYLEIPYQDDGIPLSGYSPPEGFIKVADIPADTTNHNLCDSLIGFADAAFDRSDATIFTADARAGNNYGALDYYDSTLPGTWHVRQMNKEFLMSVCNAGYRGLVFPKVSTNSMDTRSTLTEIIGYSVNKSGDDFDKVIQYTNDIGAHGVDYEFKTLHWCTMRGDKVLAFDDVNLLSLSTDGGATFPITKSVAGDVSIVTFSHIFSNGNILFCSHTKAFLSTDNLSTYAETTVLGIDGEAFVPSLYNNFRGLQYNFVSLGGVEMLAWGCYDTEDAAYENINAWYSIDNGVTIKSFYLGGTTLPLLDNPRHIHAISYVSVDNSFWIQTGDGETTDNCHWIKCLYNAGTDTWTFPVTYSCDQYGYYKSCGFVYYGTYLYWSSDSNDVDKQGVWRVPYASIGDTGAFERVYVGSAQSWCLVGTDGEEIIACFEDLNKSIVTSVDGVNFYKKILYGGDAMQATYPVYNIGVLKNNDGYYRFDIFGSADGLRSWNSGKVLVARIFAKD